MFSIWRKKRYTYNVVIRQGKNYYTNSPFIWNFSISILSKSNSRSQYRRKTMTSSRFHWRASWPNPPGKDFNWLSKGDGGGRYGFGRFHSKFGLKGNPEGSEIGGTFMVAILSSDGSTLFWLAAAAAAANKAVSLCMASGPPWPPLTEAATSANNSGRGLSSCEKGLGWK